jgi:hypothetical protein
VLLGYVLKKVDSKKTITQTLMSPHAPAAPAPNSKYVRGSPSSMSKLVVAYGKDKIVEKGTPGNANDKVDLGLGVRRGLSANAMQMRMDPQEGGHH